MFSATGKIMINPMFITIILSKDEKMTVKTLSSTDIDDFMEWATDDEVTRYMMWDSYKTRGAAEDFFNNVVEKHDWFKAICSGEKVIGSITLNKGKGTHSCKAELSYVLAKKYWGYGYATQAIQLALTTGFKELEVERLDAYVDLTNIGSQRVLEKNGFTREGLLRNYVIQKGIVKDRYVYSILKAEVK